MVFNHEVLYIHLGRTGGISVTNYLCNILKPPVIQVVSADEYGYINQSGHEFIIPWKRHANLLETAAFLKPLGISLSDFKLIFCVVRNPFDLDYSFYKQLNTEKCQKQLASDPASQQSLSAAQGNYETFALQNFTPYQGQLKDFFEINGKIPENMKVIRFEEISSAVPGIIKPFAIRDIPFPHLNKSDEKKTSRGDLSPEASICVCRKYDWISTNFYQSIMPSTKNAQPESGKDKKYLFIAGCSRSGTSALTTIIGSHSKIALGIERYNNLMKADDFLLTKEHFTKGRFINVQDGDTSYSNFSRHKAHQDIPEKWDNCEIVGVKYPQCDKIYNHLEDTFGSFYYIFIFRNIFDVAESWNRKAVSEDKWPSERNYIQAVKRWNQALQATKKLIRAGEPIICIKYEDLFFSDKSIKPVFEKLGLSIDEDVLLELTKARNLSLVKKTNKGKLSQKEYDYVASNARFDLYDEFDKNYNIFNTDLGKSNSQKPALVLHIGTEKTGTTTIQEFLYLNRQLLKDQGIAYPDSIGKRNHMQLVMAQMTVQRKIPGIELNTPEERKDWNRKLLEKFDNEMTSLPDQIKKVIISSEHFTGFIKERHDLSSLNELFNAYFSSITIIIYLRRQDQLEVSRHSTAYLLGYPAKENDFEILLNRHYYNYFHLLNMWEKEFPDARIRPRIFDQAELFDNDLITDFMRQAGIKSKPDFIVPKKLNESLSNSAVDAAIFMDMMAEKGLFEFNTKASKALRKEIIIAINQKFPGHGKKPSRPVAIEFYNKFRETNQKVAKKWFFRKQLFSEDFSMYPEYPENTSIDTAVVEEVFLQLNKEKEKNQVKPLSENQMITRSKRSSWLTRLLSRDAKA